MKTVVLALGLALAAGSAMAAEPDREARWKDLQGAIFAGKAVEPTETLVKLDAPERALDAAFVPITITTNGPDKVAGVYLIIDDNPSPYAAHFTFGPAADPAEIKLRVRVDSYTNIHAVVETKDGRLYQTARLVKAAGGCSAPAASTAAEAREGMGQMKLQFADGRLPGQPAEATLMIRHPNFNGMQRDGVTGGYTPAQYIRHVDISAGDQMVLKLDGDISISSNPVITFRVAPQVSQPMRVAVRDSQDGQWEKSFDIPTARP